MFFNGTIMLVPFYEPFLKFLELGARFADSVPEPVPIGRRDNSVWVRTGPYRHKPTGQRREREKKEMKRDGGGEEEGEKGGEGEEEMSSESSPMADEAGQRERRALEGRGAPPLRNKGSPLF